MNENEELKPGDVVQLKSGGPRMTVHKVTKTVDGESMVDCQWAVSDGMRGYNLSTRVLEKAK